MTCWLEHKRLKPGALVTLKGDDRRWIVRALYQTQLPSPPIQRWQVGGLV